MRRRKLLIADDSEMNRAILANVLDQEFEVIEATNGQEVIIALQSYGTQISALLLDIVMPEMDGFEVLEEMNRRHWIEDIPTIMISAETSNTYIGCIGLYQPPLCPRHCSPSYHQYNPAAYQKASADGCGCGLVFPQRKKQRGYDINSGLCLGAALRRKGDAHVRRKPCDGAFAALSDEADEPLCAESG